LLRQGEAAFSAEIDVDERYLRSQLGDLLKRVSPRRCAADYFDPLLLEQSAHFLPEARVVIDDQAPKRHANPTIAGTAVPRMLASPQAADVC
jgi:hypothetical protein